MFSPIITLVLGLRLAVLVTGMPQSGDPVDNGPISGPFLPNGTGPGECTSDYRMAGLKQIVFAFNLVEPGQSAAAFHRVPFRDDVKIFIHPDGTPGIPVAIDRTTAYDFCIAARQVISRATGLYTDFGNGTTMIKTNITLGLAHSIDLPVTFYSDAYLHYDLSTCLIDEVQAYMKIPSQIAGIPINPPILPQILAASPLYQNGNLPIKREDSYGLTE